jgi:phosphomannomutase
MQGGKADPGIFRAYDIRGVYGTDFDARFAQRLGTRAAEHFHGGVLVVGRDRRTGSDDLAYALIDGAMHHGSQVLDIGVVSTPQFYWAVRSLGARGGIMVTASHNPERYNGFKVVANERGVVHVVGGDRLRQLYDSTAEHHHPGGGVQMRDIRDDYAAAVAYAARAHLPESLNIAVDGPPAVTDILARLAPLSPHDGLAARLDMDGDRIAFFAEGTGLPPEGVFLTLVEGLHLHPVIFDLRFSRSVSERLRTHHTPFWLSKVGRSHLIDRMHDTEAAFGAELSGHYYWRSMGGMECPELTLLAVYRLCGGDARKLRHQAAVADSYAKSDELSIPIRDAKRARSVIALMEQRYSHCRLDRTDGLTVDCWDGGLSVKPDEGFWFNIRASNTEPVMRLVVESKEKNLLQRRVAEVRGLVG